MFKSIYMLSLHVFRTIYKCVCSCPYNQGVMEALPCVTVIEMKQLQVYKLNNN